MNAAQQLLDNMSRHLTNEAARALEEASNTRQMAFLLRRYRRIMPEAEILVGMKAVADILYLIDQVDQGQSVTLTEEHRQHLQIDLSQWVAVQHATPTEFRDNVLDLLFRCLKSWMDVMEPSRDCVGRVQSLADVMDGAFTWRDHGYDKTKTAELESALESAVRAGAVSCRE